MYRRNRLYITVISVLALILIAGVSCSNDDPTPTATPGGVTFPYVLSGSFTVDGQPGPAGSKIFTMINGKQSGAVAEAARAGSYTNVLAGVNSTEDIGEEVTIHLGDPDGDSVQAEETFIFNAVGSAQFLNLELTFPRMP